MLSSSFIVFIESMQIWAHTSIMGNCYIKALRTSQTLKANSYFDAWRLTHDCPKSRNNETVEFISYSDGWRMTVRLTHQIRIEHNALLFWASPTEYQCAYDNVQYSICSIVTFPPQYYPSFDAHKLWIKTSLASTVNRQPSFVNRHASAVMRQVWIGLNSLERRRGAPVTPRWPPSCAQGSRAT